MTGELREIDEVLGIEPREGRLIIAIEAEELSVRDLLRIVGGSDKVLRSIEAGMTSKRARTRWVITEMRHGGNTWAFALEGRKVSPARKQTEGTAECP